MHVCVMGAGIVGLAAAYELQRMGMKVTVVDQAAQVGQGASGGNGAQLSYSYVQPLADAGIWRQLPKLLLSPDSPLKVKPQWDPAQWRWALAFMQACNDDTSRRSTAQLLALAARSRAGFERMRTAEALACDFSATGKLVLYRTAQGLAAAQRQLELQRGWGSVQESVSAQRCIELEPALDHDRHRIAGAIYTPSECAADCRKVCEGLHAVLVQRGVRFVLDAPVGGLAPRAGRLPAVQAGAETIEADHFVLALGSASAGVARALGMRLPVYPLKGYSITVPAGTTADWAPRVSVTDTARKVVFARLGDRLRVAGMAELVGNDRSIPAGRIDSLRASVQDVFGHTPPSGAQVQPWTGMRPATPTGLPIVGRQTGGPGNVWVNAGHGALGFTLAFGTAAHIAEQIAQETAAAA